MKSNKQFINPSYFNYKNFLKENSPLSLPHDPEYYLNKNKFIKNLVNVLPCSIYLLNYQTGKYLYVSDNCERLLGITANEFMEKGNSFFIERLHPDDAKIIAGDAFIEFIDYVKTMDAEDLKNCRFSLNYRFKTESNDYIHLLQQYVIIETTADQFPLLTMGFVTDISAHKQDNKVVFSVSKYSKKTGFSVMTSQTFPKEKLEITKRENQIVGYLIKGLTSKNIALKLNLSLYTIHAHRRNILEKTNCKNTAELINFALNHCLG